jgi:hypothetical protein
MPPRWIGWSHNVDAIAHLAIGFVLGSNILTGEPFDGTGVWAGGHRLELAPPLGLLGWPADRRLLILEDIMIGIFSYDT